MNICVQAYKENEELPENQAELYQKVINCLITTYVCKHDACKDIQSSILLLEDLPVVYKNHLINLSKVDFNCIKTSKITFTNMDFKACNQDSLLLNCNFLGLGLLKIMCLDDCVSYSFLHSSIQEYLAAYYICSQEPCVRFELLKNTFSLKSTLVLESCL